MLTCNLHAKLIPCSVQPELFELLWRLEIGLSTIVCLLFSYLFVVWLHMWILAAHQIKHIHSELCSLKVFQSCFLFIYIMSQKHFLRIFLSEEPLKIFLWDYIETGLIPLDGRVLAASSVLQWRILEGEGGTRPPKVPDQSISKYLCILNRKSLSSL